MACRSSPTTVKPALPVRRAVTISACKAFTSPVYNFRQQSPQPPAEAPTDGPFAAWAATTDTDWPTYTRERPGMSAFALGDGVVYHTYWTYARGLDSLWGMYQWLDRAPRGRNETRTEDDPLNFFRRHDDNDGD
jgi:predicted dithiol-disulfide oxidoreductase (DUF899 family)